jgi:glycosyltransferase involved in cell wall biosynthesis
MSEFIIVVPVDKSVPLFHDPRDDHSGKDDRFEKNNPIHSRPETGVRNLSFIVPVQDEEATIGELYSRIEREVDSHNPSHNPFEVIFVDDGSKDESWKKITQLARIRPDHVRGIKFRRHAGKAAALTAGFRAARGDVIFTLDADLQDDPAEIPKFIKKLDEGFDIVSGWKKVRHDPWHKVWPSRIFNRMLSRMGGVSLHDQNCGFKCYRAQVARGLFLHGELHRMIPSIAAMKGYSSSEIEVHHHPRLHGRSKYGIERFLRGFMDMLTIWFLRRYGERPLHLVGGVSLTMLGLGILFLILGAGLLGVLSTWGFMLTVLGCILVASFPVLIVTGLISELLNRGGLEHQWELPIAEDTASDTQKSQPLHVQKTEKEKSKI